MRLWQKEYKVPIQSLIDHIKTAMDVDPWAKDMSEELLSRMIQKEVQPEGGGSLWWSVCPECHGNVGSNDHFCRHCGQALK